MTERDDELPIIPPLPPGEVDAVKAATRRDQNEASTVGAVQEIIRDRDQLRARVTELEPDFERRLKVARDAFEAANHALAVDLRAALADAERLAEALERAIQLLRAPLYGAFARWQKGGDPWASKVLSERDDAIDEVAAALAAQRAYSGVVAIGATLTGG